MHILSTDRNIHDLLRYFYFFDVSLSKNLETQHLSESLHSMIEKLKRHSIHSEDAEHRQLIMRAKMTVCIFFLRKTVISLGKEIRKAELAIQSVNFYEDLLPHLPPGNQLPLALQMQKFMEIIETALFNFHKIPEHPKCESVLSQRETLEYWLQQAKALLEENQKVTDNLNSVRHEFQEIQKEVHQSVHQLRNDLLPIFDYIFSDVNQYFLTLVL